MNPATRNWIVQRVRHWRAGVTSDETWAQGQPKCPMRDEYFRSVVFLRYALQLVELILGEYDASPAEGTDQRRRFWICVVSVAQRQLATK